MHTDAFARPHAPIPRTARRSRGRVWRGAAAAVLVIAILGVMIGSVTIPLETIGQVMGAHVFGSPAVTDPVHDQIIWDVRVPRVLAGVLVGTALAVTGVVIQAVVRNPLGDHYVIGVTPGASLGAVAAIVLGAGLSRFGVAAAAFAGALAAFAGIVALARRGRGWHRT
ncbi:hypothetical protein Acor_84640 [Acrocarpospora corrugata]|uniref:Iron ABC transporter permease n=1 Tax=Acrocarpospora corrugata TaxID=35763 RepID=A0A5M3WBH9_9ACTN|nr:hypothetical protein Acor_84640 [Acrocarpospora corrugata]